MWCQHLTSCSCRQKTAALAGQGAESVRPENENRVTNHTISGVNGELKVGISD